MKKHPYQNPTGVPAYTGLLLISPFIIGAVIFTVYPFVCSFILGMTESSISRELRFTGLKNYAEMFRSDSFRNALSVTVKYALILVPLKLIVSLLTAMLLNAEIKGMRFFRTAFYLPSILGSNLAVVIMWQYLFKSKGLVNQLLGLCGAAPVSWYGDSRYALFIIVLLRLWEFGSTMLIFFTALRDIPSEYYEAARVDGCGAVRSFFSITLPQLKNVIFINLVLQTIAALQEFNAPYMITGGNPMKSTYTIGMLIYDEMFAYSDIGSANAVSWVLFAFITLTVVILFRITGRLREEKI
ncbi:MAG: sugar ABC transporter permease [Ruminococcus sp.]|nr:sugar ABC transporter permease [Ruminococcus sp.]